MITQKVDLNDNALSERVARLHVLALSVGRHDLPENVTLYSMGKERGASRLGRFVNFNRVAAPLLLRHRVDVAFVHMCPIYAILAAPWAKLVRVPIVLWFTHKSVNWKLKLAHWLVDRVVTASPESFRLPSDKVVVTGHGIDTDLFKPAEGPRPDRPFTVLSVGRISPIKDYETLIEAADILVNQQGQRNLRFVVVGDVGTPEQAAYREQLLAEVQQRRLRDCFEFMGGVPHRRVVEYYQQADLFVNLSRTDSLDKAVLEAMACGLVPLTSNIAFGPLLGTLTSRLTFSAQDAVNLARKLEQLAHLPEAERGALRKELRTMVVQQHSVHGLMDRLVEVCGRGGR
jgi:glycosyltransferase involved in cell wall biosynthesis